MFATAASAVHDVLAALALAAQFATISDPDWTTKKRLLRERLTEVVAAANALHERNDDLPQLNLDRLHGRHGEYSHAWDVMTLDLESIHDPAKFWHVYDETIAHEWAHRLNASIHRSRGHGEDFRRLLTTLKREVRFRHNAAKHGETDDAVDSKTRR